MNYLVFLIIIMVLISSVSQVFAQQFSLGIPATQKVEITIGENSEVHVKHIVLRDTKVRQINLISGVFENLTVSDVNGNDVQYAQVRGETLGISIFPTRTDVIVEYDLDGVLNLNENGIWDWHYIYLEESKFIFPQNIDLIFSNSRPIDIADGNAIRCHGCVMWLEYVIDEPLVEKQIGWEDKTFQVQIRTLAEISSFTFDQPTKRISFDVNADNQFVTLVIPLELLWNPYTVYYTDKNVEIFEAEQKIIKHEFNNNGTHVSLNVRPATSGTLHIVGTTVIPEFPYFMPLFLGFIMIIAIQFRNKLNHR